MMPMRIKTVAGLIVLLLAASWPQPGYAQAAPITAEVDQTELSTDDTLTLTVTIVGPTDLLTPSLPPLGGMVVLDRSTSSQINIVEGKTAVEVTHRYSLQPTRTGSLTIGPISVDIEGETFRTAPIALEVEEGTGSTPTGELPDSTSNKLVGQDFYVEAVVDNSRPYLGEQVTYMFRFYRSKAPSSQLRYDAPAFRGFWTDPETGRREYEVRAAGRRYQVIELRSVLFPTAPGPAVIGPAVLTIPEPEPEPPRVLSVEPVSLEVESLPPNAPDDFNGAVGQFEIAAEIEKTSGSVNDAIGLAVTLSGQGNIDTLPDPLWTDWAQWRTLDDGTTVNADVSDDKLAGSRVYHRVLIPQTEGNFEILPISYTYFDPVQAEYRTVATEPIRVVIGEGMEGTPVIPLPAPGASADVESVSEIRSIKGTPSVLRSARQPLTGLALYWAGWGIPLLFLGAALAWRMRIRQGAGINDLTRSMNVYREARRQLDRERRRKGSDPFEASERILTDYLDKRLNRSVNGMTYSRLARFLEEQGISHDLAQRVMASLSVSEGGRFAPESERSGTGKELLRETGELISDLEKEFGL